MEAAEPIKIETQKPRLDDSQIDFIEELIIKKEKENFKIQFGIKGKDLVIKVTKENSKDIFYYQQIYTIKELQMLPKVFVFYETLKDLIFFLKGLKFDKEEQNDDLIIKFNIFMPNGENKLIEFLLKKFLPDNNDLIKYLSEEIKAIKIDNMNNQSEIKELKSEIKELKQKNMELTNENKKLWDEINELKQHYQKSNIIEGYKISFFDSKIIESKDSINFILDYIRQNDKSFNFNNIKLLYRGSKDGDRTKTCHELCDNKQNVLIFMQSDNNYIFGGYSKIGFKIGNKEYKVDNNSFLFSMNLKQIYPVIKDKNVICNISDKYGLCFGDGLSFFDNFMNQNDNQISLGIQGKFTGIKDKYKMNGGKNKFKCKELEVFQLL